MTEFEIQHIPLNRLKVSVVNVRKTERTADVEALAASIRSHGLLQNLSVVADDDGKFSVVAGGRRLAALKLLAKSGAIAKDFEAPCQVIAREAAPEASLAENIHRVAMDPVDEADAFAILQGQGSAVDEIARRFGVTLRHVEQRLVLCKLSPKLRSAWKKRELTLDAARAFCLVDDHTRQDAVFKSLGKPVTHAGSVRARLMEDRMRASDRLVRFVGLENYEAAGGAVRRDLFDADAVFIEDGALVAVLAERILAAAAENFKQAGWGWVETSLDGCRPDGVAALRLQPIWRDATDAEEAQMQQVQEKIDALDAALNESSVEDDPRWSDRDDLEAAYETIRQAARTWDGELMKFAGVIVSVDHSGALLATEGYVRKDDQKLIDAIKRGGQSEARHEDDETSVPTQTAVVGMPKALARDLTSHRTRAIRAGVAQDVDIALSVCVAALGSRLLRRQTLQGVDVSCGMSDFDDSQSLMRPLDAAMPEQPRAALEWCLKQDRAALLTHLSTLVACAIDLSHEDSTAGDADRQAVSDCIASALDLDMAAVWSPSIEFWIRLPKSVLLEELKDAAETHELPDAAQADWLRTAAKLKKDALAQRVHEAWRGRRYLPELLVTPLAAGSLSVAGNIAIAAE